MIYSQPSTDTPAVKALCCQLLAAHRLSSRVARLPVTQTAFQADWSQHA